MDLQSVSDSSLEQGLQDISFNINDNKFSNGFSAYGLSKLLLGLNQDALRGKVTEIPDAALEGIRWRGVFIIRAYVSLVYLRSEVLERGLDHVSATSPLRPFRDIFRSGNLRKGEDTILQHMRNSLAHGSFDLSEDCATVNFQDRDWAASFSVDDVFSLCFQVYRFYCAAFSRKS